jgi:hypothetical protein
LLQERLAPFRGERLRAGGASQQSQDEGEPKPAGAGASGREPWGAPAADRAGKAQQRCSIIRHGDVLATPVAGVNRDWCAERS